MGSLHRGNREGMSEKIVAEELCFERKIDRMVTASHSREGATVSDLVRFSVSLEADLLAKFDRFCEENRMATRSEAVRQLLHERLTTAAWESDAADVTATLTLVYDHHRTHLT